jgi:hypothetical protein
MELGLSMRKYLWLDGARAGREQGEFLGKSLLLPL